jgi:hypothetical protein
MTRMKEIPMVTGRQQGPHNERQRSKCLCDPAPRLRTRHSETKLRAA